MTVDISKIQAGDEITIRTKVRERSTTSPGFWCDSPGRDRYIHVDNADMIVEHHPAPPPPPKVGDRVTGDRATGARGKLLGVSGEHAWVHWDGWACPVTIPSAIVKKVDQ